MGSDRTGAGSAAGQLGGQKLAPCGSARRADGRSAGSLRGAWVAGHPEASSRLEDVGQQIGRRHLRTRAGAAERQRDGRVAVGLDDRDVLAGACPRERVLRVHLAHADAAPRSVPRGDVHETAALARRGTGARRPGAVVALERLDLEVGSLDRDPRLAQDDQELPRHVLAGEVDARVGLGQASRTRLRDGFREGVPGVQTSEQVRERPRQHAVEAERGDLRCARGRARPAGRAAPPPPSSRSETARPPRPRPRASRAPGAQGRESGSLFAVTTPSPAASSAASSRPSSALAVASTTIVGRGASSRTRASDAGQAEGAARVRAALREGGGDARRVDHRDLPLHEADQSERQAVGTGREAREERTPDAAACAEDDQTHLSRGPRERGLDRLRAPDEGAPGLQDAHVHDVLPEATRPRGRSTSLRNDDSSSLTARPSRRKASCPWGEASRARRARGSPSVSATCSLGG